MGKFTLLGSRLYLISATVFARERGMQRPSLSGNLTHSEVRSRTTLEANDVKGDFKVFPYRHLFLQAGSSKSGEAERL